MNTVTIFVVNSKIPQNGRANTIFLNNGHTLESAKKLYPFLQSREILSAKNEELEVVPYGKTGKYFKIAYTDELVNASGILSGTDNSSQPIDMETITDLERHTSKMTGNPMPNNL